MSRMAERLARAEARLAAIEARDQMVVIVDRYNGKPPLLIDYRAKPVKASKISKPKWKANTRRTAARRSRRAVETAR